MSKKKAEVIYRIVNDEGRDDVDLTRAEAIRIYRELRAILFPRVVRTRHHTS